MLRPILIAAALLAAWGLSLGYAQGLGFRVGYQAGYNEGSGSIDRDRSCAAWWFDPNKTRSIAESLNRICKQHKGQPND